VTFQANYVQTIKFATLDFFNSATTTHCTSKSRFADVARHNSTVKFHDDDDRRTRYQLEKKQHSSFPTFFNQRCQKKISGEIFLAKLHIFLFWPNYIFFCFGRIIQKKYRGRINKIQKFLAECDFISLFDSAFGLWPNTT
jgi:hypothetical protein